jgi:ElaB/YqjD/DUF883 family membrane-anchored ribosome-binding protein
MDGTFAGWPRCLSNCVFTQFEANMTIRSKNASTADEIAAIQELMSDLEKRLHRLSGATKREFSGASGEINDFVNDALAGIMDRVREGAHSATDKAAHFGGDAVKKITDEVEQRPLAMLAIAAGIGFLFGLARR